MGACTSIKNRLFHYEKEKRYSIADKRIVYTCRTLQILIIVYILGYSLFYKKGYQEIGIGDVVTTAELKGVIVTNFSDKGIEYDKDMYTRVWDSSEYASTSSESQGFFVATNFIITPNQTMGTCDENPYKEDANCTGTSDCIKELHKNLGNGHRTGRCIPSKIIQNQKVCEITAWCPVENEKFPLNGSSLLKEAEDFTVFIRSEVYFYKFGEEYRRNNILKTNDKDYLDKCRYEKEIRPYCPIFTIKTMVKEAMQDFKDMSILGGVITVTVKWNCNLDYDFNNTCKPEYEFRRVDDDSFNEVKGYSIRKAYHHDLKRRTLVNYYGIKFVFINQAIGGKFSFTKLIINIAVASTLWKLSTMIPNLIYWLMKMHNIPIKKIDEGAENAVSQNKQELPEKENQSNGIAIHEVHQGAQNGEPEESQELLNKNLIP